MAGLFSKVTRFASSPQGQAALAKAKAAANDPKNRAKFDDLVVKVKERAGGLAAQTADRDRGGRSGTGTTTTVTPVPPSTTPATTPPVTPPTSPAGS